MCFFPGEGRSLCSSSISEDRNLKFPISQWKLDNKTLFTSCYFAYPSYPLPPHEASFYQNTGTHTHTQYRHILQHQLSDCFFFQSRQLSLIQMSQNAQPSGRSKVLRTGISVCPQNSSRSLPGLCPWEQHPYPPNLHHNFCNQLLIKSPAAEARNMCEQEKGDKDECF